MSTLVVVAKSIIAKALVKVNSYSMRFVMKLTYILNTCLTKGLLLSKLPPLLTLSKAFTLRKALKC